MKIKVYNPQVEVLWSTPDPAKYVLLACSNTMKGKFLNFDYTPTLGARYRENKNIMNFLVDADHTNPFGHVCISFRFTNFSRACADQLVRHTTISWTMSSTHYQNHSEYDGFMCNEMASRLSEYDTDYTHLANEYGHDEARQVLPLATEVSLVGTGNIIAWLNFLEKRMCLRNTMETVLLANAIEDRIREWFPEVSERLGPKCFYSRCNQGKMACDMDFKLTHMTGHPEGHRYETKYHR